MQSLVVGSCNTATTSSADRFSALTNSSRAAQTTVTADKSVISVAGTVDRLYLVCETAPASGLTRTFEVYKTTAAGVTSNTGIKVDLVDTATSGSDLTHSITVAPGDQLSLRTSATGTTASTGNTRWSFRFVGTTGGESLICGGSSNTVSASATNYFPVYGNVAVDTTAATVAQIVPAAGVISNMYALVNGTPGSGTSHALTLMKNGSATSLTCTISDTNTSNSDTNAAHAVTVAAGDTVSWRCVPTGTPTARVVMIGVRFVPTTDGESVIMFGNSGVTSTSAVRYQRVAGALALAPSATEGPEQVPVAVASCSFKNLRLLASVAPGTGKAYVGALSLGGSTTGGPSASILDTNTTAQDLTNVRAAVAGDLVAMKITPSSTPTASAISWSMVCYIAVVNNYTQTLSGSTTAAGIVAKLASKQPAGSSTPSGIAGRLAVKLLAASITATGALVKMAAKAPSGSATPAGVITTRDAAKVLAGISTPSGTAAKAVGFHVAGATTPSGAFNALLVLFQSLSGSITAVGALIRQAANRPAGSVSLSSSLARSGAMTRAGSTTPQGTAAKAVSYHLAGSSTPSGIVSQLSAAFLSLAGSISPAGLLRRVTGKTLVGQSAPAATVTRASSKSLAGSTAPLGVVAKKPSKLLVGLAAAVGSLLTAVAHVFVSRLGSGRTSTSSPRPTSARGDAGPTRSEN